MCSFFDEFDVVGKERGDAHETGEIKRVVSNLLLQIDALPSHVVAIAATNHSELLDSAVWRRFQLRLSMPSPDKSALADFFTRTIEAFGENPGLKPETIVRRIGLMSYAEASEFLLDVRRRQVLSLGQSSYAEVLREQIALWAARTNPESNAKRSNKTAFKTGSSAARATKAGEATTDSSSRKVSQTAPKRSDRAKVHAPKRRARSGTGSRRTKK